MENNKNNNTFSSEFYEYEKRQKDIMSYRKYGMGWLILFYYTFLLGTGLTIGAFFLEGNERSGLLIAGIVFLVISVLAMIKFIHERQYAKVWVKDMKSKNDAFIAKYGYERVKMATERSKELDKSIHRAVSEFWEATKPSNRSSYSSYSSSSSSSSYSTKRDCYHDGKGVYRTPNEGFYDSKGIYREKGDDFFDGKGVLRKSGENYFDSSGELRSPGESFIDSNGDRRN